MRFKLVVAYLGGPFAGWQRQPGCPTIQRELEIALQRVTHQRSVLVDGAGRTDAGVHAAGQTAHVDLRGAIPPDRLMVAVNRLLPDAIRVIRCREVSSTFHARRSARAKLYTYRVGWQPPSLPWLELRTATLAPPKAEAALVEALGLLPGRHDMASFTVPDPGPRSTRRTLFRAWQSRRKGGITLHFMGDGFLRYQVRRMVGALFEVGWGRRSVEQFRSLLDDPRPGHQVRTAPARGLTLERVYYRLPAGVTTFEVPDRG